MGEIQKGETAWEGRGGVWYGLLFFLLLHIHMGGKSSDEINAK